MGLAALQGTWLEYSSEQRNRQYTAVSHISPPDADSIKMQMLGRAMMGSLFPSLLEVPTAGAGLSALHHFFNKASTDVSLGWLYPRS